MKSKFLLTMGIVFLLFLQYSSTNAQTSNDITRLQKLIKQVTPNIQIEHWSIQIRENFQSSEIEMKDQITKKYKGIQWLENEKSIKGTLKRSSNNFYIEFIIIPIKKGNQKRTLVIGNFTGANEKSLKNEMLQSSIVTTFFTGKAKSFSCLKGSIDGNMGNDLTYIVDDFIKTFDAEIIEKVSENGFTSVSAKSYCFSGELTNQMNVQLALRSLSDRTIVTVGTPIITEEY
ncbi:MAG: hypothetical protein K0R71_686 [Bacillales bacterium]|jgi:hypothetical protein|nr:hypothetical protein [Bacillales bacterium]